MSLANLPVSEMPRERLMRDGVEALSLQELLAILLGTGVQGKSVLVLAQELLQHFGGMQNLLNATIEDLMQIKGIGFAKAILLKAAFGITVRCYRESIFPRSLIRNPDQAFALSKHHIGHLSQEALFVILRDIKGRLVHQEIVAVGTLSEVLVHPREVFHPAVRHRAHSIIVAHNHPSGDVTPSKADFALTEHLMKSSRIMGIALDDHLIITATHYMSFRKQGYLGKTMTY